IALALILQVIRFIVGDKIGEQRHEYKQTDHVESCECDGIALKAPPNIGPESFGNVVNVLFAGRHLFGSARTCGRRLSAHCWRRPKAIRGSTVASKRSEIRMPIRVSTAVTVNNASTVG